MTESTMQEITILDASTDGGHQWWELSDEVNCQIEFKTMQHGLSQGVQVGDVVVGCVQLRLLLSRGGNIGRLAFHGVDVGWKSPIQGPVHPQFVPLYRPDGLGWLAGFDEVLARCGFSNVGGPEFNDQNQLVRPLHGALSCQPCRSAKANVDKANRRLILETEVEECLFHFNRIRLTSQTIVSMDRPEIQVLDSIENLGTRSAEVMLLHHWNFGEPVVGDRSEIHVAHQAVAPRNAHASRAFGQWDTMQKPESGSEETVYFFEPSCDDSGIGHAMVCDVDRKNAVKLSWPVKGLPCFTLWKNPVALEDGCAIGLEPGTCYPNGFTHEQQSNRTITLEAGQKHEVSVKVQGMLDAKDEITETIDQLQNLSARAQKYSSPQQQFGPIDG